MCVAVLLAQAAGNAGAAGPRCDTEKMNKKAFENCQAATAKAGPRNGGFKVQATRKLDRQNQPPTADLVMGEVFDRHVELDASGSTDDDGFVEQYTFQLMDADTEEVLAGPLTLRSSFARLEARKALPQNLLATLGVEDDIGGTDSTEMQISLGAAESCGNTLFSCSSNGDDTKLNCTPRAANTSFRTQDLLDATNGCSAFGADGGTRLEIYAAGGAGGRGANFWPNDGGKGGKGGVAGLVTSTNDLGFSYGDSANYCYGIGSQGGHKGNNAGAGGAASLLRICGSSDTSQLLVLGPGGGGGGAANLLEAGGDGGHGGSAFSQNASGRGQQGQPGGGAPGEGGIGGMIVGTNTQTGDGLGGDGIGGRGGPAKDWGRAGFFRGDPGVVAPAGVGGDQEVVGGGSGGGGWGGGAAGGNFKLSFVSTLSQGGGGGGAFSSSFDDSASRGQNSGKGYLLFRFVKN